MGCSQPLQYRPAACAYRHAWQREDGKDLVIPYDYIARGLRERAHELVSLELGPVSELEHRQRMRRMMQFEHFTDIDRALLRRARDGTLDLSKPVSSGQVWQRQLEKARMGRLAKNGAGRATCRV